ncbi:F-box domain-containing protein [Mycena chlorophos]|uniref:F-box domain-containing protein n=1 Tax=Mycena chlorophos TaxID=658473 RepID=A0A8H6WLN4_MYCCL|nr:F-box domain-containing protein [Mycena chlorophos]
MADPTLCSRCRMNLFRRSPLLPTPTQTAEVDALLRSNLAAAAGFGTMLDDGTAESELARYATEIEGVQMRLQELIMERDKLEEYISRVRSACTAHIRRLPQEILGEILEHCAPLLEEYKMRLGVVEFMESERERLAKLPLLNLAKVSSRWRQIIMKTPQLWATVVVDWHLWRDYDKEVHMDLLSETIERSAHHALTVILLGPVNTYDCPPIRILLQHASSWVHLYANITSTLHLLFAPSRFPNLKSLEIGWADAPRLFSVKGANAVPSLRSFSYKGNLNNLPTVPWKQLVFFEYTAASSHAWFHADHFHQLPWRILPKGSTLHFSSRLYSPGSNFRQRSLNSSPIQAQIARLTLRLGPDDPQEDAASVLPVLFSDLVLPELVHLHLLNYEESSPQWPIWEPHEFAALASRSGFPQNVRSLALGVDITRVELFAALRLLEALEELRLSDCPNNRQPLITDALLQDLSSPLFDEDTGTGDDSDATHLVPQLRLLELITLGCYTEAALVDFLASRVSLRATRQDVERPFRIELHLVRDPEEQTLNGRSEEFWKRVENWKRERVLEVEYNDEWNRLGWREGAEDSWR